MLLLRIILFSIPEAALVTLLSVSFLGEKISWRHLIPIAFFTGVIVFAAAEIIGSFVLNFFLLILVIFLGLGFSKVKNVFKRLIAVSLAVSTYFMIEFININILVIFLGLNPQNLKDNITLHIFAFLPQLLLMLILAHYIPKKGMILFGNES